MKGLNKRHGVLIGALVLALAVWAADSFSRRPGPAKAQAAQAAAPPPAVADWDQVHPVVEALTRRSYRSVAADLEQIPRDLFHPTPIIEAALLTAAPASDPNAATQPEVAEPDFRSRHRLSGVVLGRVPMAIVDDQLLRRGAELSGYRLVEIRRDSVVFQGPRPEDQVTLTVERGAPASLERH